MIKFIYFILLSTLLIGCNDSSSKKDQLLTKIESLQKSNDELKQKNDSLSTLIIPALEIEEDLEIREFSKNVTIVTPPTPSPKPTAPVNNNNSSEELIDSKTDDNDVNPFGGTSDNYSFGPWDGQSDGGNQGNGQGSFTNGNAPGTSAFGGPKLLNKPTIPNFDTDYSGIVCAELLISEKGKAISAKSCNSTSHPDQYIVKSVIEYIKKNVTYKAEPGAGNRKAFFSIYIPAN